MEIYLNNNKKGVFGILIFYQENMIFFKVFVEEYIIKHIKYVLLLDILDQNGLIDLYNKIIEINRPIRSQIFQETQIEEINFLKNKKSKIFSMPLQNGKYKSWNIKRDRTFICNGQRRVIRTVSDVTKDYVLSYERDYKAGKLHGKDRVYDNGRLIREYSFVNDRYNGVSKEWDQNGLLYSETNYKNGFLHGNCKYYKYVDGKLHHEYNYKNGNLHGTAKYYRYSGQLEKLENYTNRKLNGKMKEWHSNGKIKVEYFFKKGRKCGTWKYWDTNGELIKKINY